MALTFTACGASFSYDKEEAVKKAEEIVDLTNKRDYQAIYNLMPAELQSQVSADELKKGWDPMLDASGTFVEYSAQTSGLTQKGVNYIVVVVSAKYEKETRIFTISFTTDMVLAGLFMK